MIVLPDLPYGYDDLAPTVSGETLRTHHDKHHAAYVKKTNELSAKAGLADLPLEEVVREARAKSDIQLFNNAAQAWNHGFFWQCMTPGGAQPPATLETAIGEAFGGIHGLRQAFVKEGVGHFASGWVWLVQAGRELKVISTHDADDTLLREGVRPLLVCDLWEHAYYLDYKNDRQAFLERWFDSVANWSFAAQQLGGDGWRYPAPESLRKAS